MADTFDTLAGIPPNSASPMLAALIKRGGGPALKFGRKRQPSQSSLYYRLALSVQW